MLPFLSPTGSSGGCSALPQNDIKVKNETSAEMGGPYHLVLEKQGLESVALCFHCVLREVDVDCAVQQRQWCSGCTGTPVRSLLVFQMPGTAAVSGCPGRKTSSRSFSRTSKPDPFSVA